MRNIIFAVFTVLLVLIGCQTLPPTQVTETRSFDIQQLVQKTRREIRLDEQTVIIDARTPFDYAMAHVPNSINLRWEDFSQLTGRAPGLLRPDLDRMAHRLALYGVLPETPVVIVGYGREGAGEEGRLAWTLYYLGVKDIQFVSINYFSSSLTSIESSPRVNAPVWKANPLPTILTDRKEVLQALKLEEGKSKTHIIDVRTEREYFSKSGLGEPYSTPDLGAINIDWREFLDENGRPDRAMRSRLSGIGIRPQDRILLISQKGVRSGAVTMALLSIGFYNVANYAGGYADLLK